MCFGIAGRPQFTDRKLNTVQYVFSDNTDGVNFSCPLSEPGQLIGMPNFTPYEYEWFLNTRVRVATNALSDNNRTLHVHLPTSEPLEDYRFVCHADIRRCNSSSTNRCGAITTRNAMLYPSPPGFQVKIVGECLLCMYMIQIVYRNLPFFVSRELTKRF